MIEIKQDKKKVFLETYGCQMNEYDTELVKAILTKKEYCLTKNELEADVVMLNTCAIRENAHRKVYGRIHDIRHKRDGKPVMIGLLGCMVTNLRKELLDDKKLKIDFIAGPDSYKRLPDLIEEAGATGQKAFDVTLSEFETYSDVYPSRQEGVNAWIAVSRGCNNFCTFCVVPYTRGRERSRTVANVLEEVRRLAQDGFKQVTLLGQNVNSYRDDDNKDFADLMEAVASVDGIERIRFTSPHPKDFPDRFLDLMASNKKICKHIHLPMQSGNTRVLDLMNRTYTREEFLALVDKIRAKIPGVALTTDVIVGFSSETDAEFKDTFTAMKQVEFDSAFIFKYSERKQTMASRKFPDNISEEKKTERIVRLNELQKEIAFKKNLAVMGQTITVLVEKPDREHPDGIIPGRTDSNKIVLFKGDVPAGTFVDVNITAATPNGFRGEIKK